MNAKHKQKMDRVKVHRRLKWFWVGVLAVGLVDHFVWPGAGIANSIPVLFGLSVAALAIGEWAAEEAADDD